MEKFSNELKESIRQLLGDSISEREKRILEARCLGEKTRTHRELAEEIGVSSARIYQLENRLRLRIAKAASKNKDSFLGRETRRQLQDEEDAHQREEEDREEPMLMRLLRQKTNRLPFRDRLPKGGDASR